MPAKDEASVPVVAATLIGVSYTKFILAVPALSGIFLIKLF